MMREHCFVRQDFTERGVETSPAGTQLGFAQMVVAQIYGVSLGELLAPTRKDRHAAEARQVAMYLGHVVFRMKLTAVGRVFGRDRSTASHACRRVEDLRDDPQLDQLIGWLEVLLRSASGAVGTRMTGAAK